MKLSIEVKPFKDESFISWFSRTAFSNGTDPKSFALSIWMKDSMFYRDLDRFIPKKYITPISKVSSMSSQKIKNLTLESIIDDVDTSLSENPYKKWYFLLPQAQKGKIRTNGIHFCPECLNEEIPYINKYWRISWYTSCPIHKVQLILNCPNCNQVFSPEKQDELNPHIYLCSKCKFDLRKSKVKKIENDLILFQNKLLDSLIRKDIKTFNLLVTRDKKDLFLTLNILLAFFYKVLRQPIRFKKLIDNLNIVTNHNFTSFNNGTFSRLPSKDRKELLLIVDKIFKYKTHEFILILKKGGITQLILKQTFKNLSPTVSYINKHLPDKKLIRKYNRKKKEILPKSISEVETLFEAIIPYIIDRNLNG